MGLSGFLATESYFRPTVHAASRHGTPSLTSLPKDGEVSCEVRPPRSPIRSLTSLDLGSILKKGSKLGRLTSLPSFFVTARPRALQAVSKKDGKIAFKASLELNFSYLTRTV